MEAQSRHNKEGKLGRSSYKQPRDRVSLCEKRNPNPLNMIDLGFLRKRASSSGSQCLKRIKKNKQQFAYLIVIDFESTCWENVKYKTQEIIEFPAVLLNTSTGEIDSEFHHYLQPQENPYLSDFCKQLTGITQDQVDQGIPLSFTLKRFSSWLQRNTQERNISYDAFSSHDTKCAFVTWSDWDLGVCLQYEARRKQLRKPAELNTWIDLRATYRNFYQRRPQGLNGALQDLGISFEGREHSGLCDARNTAHLAWRMMTDGCVLHITKTLTPPVTGRPCQIGPKIITPPSINTVQGIPDKTTHANTSAHKTPATTAVPQSTAPSLTGTVCRNQIPPHQAQHRVLETTPTETRDGSPVQESAQPSNVLQNQLPSHKKEANTADQQMPTREICTSKMSVALQRVTSCGQIKTLSMNDVSDISSILELPGNPETMSTSEVACTSASVQTPTIKLVMSSGPKGSSSHPHRESHPLEASANVQVPSPACGATSASNVNQTVSTRGPPRTSISPKVPSEGPLSLRTSVSPQVLSGGPLTTSASPQVPSGGPLRNSVSPQVPSGGPLRNSVSPKVPPGGPPRTLISPQVPSGGPLRTSVSPQVPSGGPLRTSTSPQVPPGGALMTSVSPQVPAGGPSKPAQPCSSSSERDGPLQSTKGITRNYTSIVAQKKVQVSGSGASFTIYQDKNTSRSSSTTSLHTAGGQKNNGKFKTPSPVGGGTKVSGLFKTPSPPCNLSSSDLVPSSYPERVPFLDTSNFMTPNTSSISNPSSSNMKRTPPMCGCGRRSHRKLVQTPGPNQGRAFYCCPGGRNKPSNRTIGGAKKQGCGFFKWEGTKDPNSSVTSNLGSFYNSMASNSSGHSVKRTQSFVIPPLPQPDFNTPQSAQRLTKDTKNTGKTLGAGQSITVGQLRY